MASIGTERNGRRRILFASSDGRRKTLRLGRCSQRDAEQVKLRVELILISQLLGNPLDAETAKWLMERDEVMYGRLAGVGLCLPRETLRLGAWIDGYLAERTDLKPRTVKTVQAARIHLVGYFGEDRDVRTITRDEASRWEAKLKSSLAKATVRLYVGIARTLFGKAVTRELIQKNVFDHLASGTVASTNTRYVTPEESERIIKACTDIRTKLLFAFPRYAGLRFPSEVEPLTWADVDMAAGKLTVRSPKTEHHVGREKRVVPILPPLMKLLKEARGTVQNGTHFIDHRSDIYNRARLDAAIKAAGVTPWADMFRVLRSSCEKQWAMEFPQFAVSKWMGHGITISGKHYANAVPDELYARAAQNSAQSAVGPTNPEVPAGNGETKNTDDFAPAASSEVGGSKRISADFPGKYGNSQKRRTESGALERDLSKVTRAGRLARKVGREHPDLRRSLRQVMRLAGRGRG